MKYVQPDTPFEVVLTDAPSGLAGTLGLRIVKKGSTTSPRETAGIIEYPAGSGVYEYTHPGVATAGQYAALWDTGLVDPDHTAVEDIIVTTGPSYPEVTTTPGSSVDMTAANWPSGLAGLIGVAVIDNQGNTTTPRSTGAISEYPSGSGLYWVTLTAPLVEGDYSVVWDDADTRSVAATLLVSTAPVSPGGGGVGPVLQTGVCGPMMPWLSFCGVEVTNAARVASYISRGLAPSGHYVAYPAALPSILWRTTGVEETFTSPSVDNAAWYDSTITESGDFLGFICDRVSGIDSTETRTSTPSSSYRGGSILDAATLLEREIVLHGYLVASSEPGVEYGRRWLADMLGADPTACADCNLALRVTSPPDDATNDRQGLWNLYRVALRKLDVSDPFRCPDLREVTITLVAGDPVLYKDALVCASHEVLSPGSGDGTCLPFDEWFCGDPIDAPICCTISPRRIGRVASIVTLSVESGVFGGARVTLNDTCAAASDEPADAEALIGPLPVGASLTIDSAQHRVVYSDPSGTVWDGVPYLTLPPGKSVPWLDVAPRGEDVCLCIEPLHPCSGGGGTFVTIQTQRYEK